WGFCGIKVHRHDGRISREVCETARRFSVPVLYDVMGEATVVELLATEYPTVAFIVPHLGSFSDDWGAQRRIIEQLVAHPNVHTDTSGIRRFDLLAEAVSRAGPEKVLFGTDGPWLHPGVELAKVRALGLPAAAERLILAGNWLRLTARARVMRLRWPGTSIRIRESVPRPADSQPPPAVRGDPWAVQPGAATGPTGSFPPNGASAAPGRSLPAAVPRVGRSRPLRSAPSGSPHPARRDRSPGGLRRARARAAPSQ